MSNNAHIERLDHYTLKINHSLLVTANADQEQKLRDMDQEQIDNFIHIMGGDDT